MQRVLMVEREDTSELEREIRLLHASERLKERLKSLENHFQNSNGEWPSIPTGSLDQIMRKTPSTQSKQETLEENIYELFVML